MSVAKRQLENFQQQLFLIKNAFVINIKTILKIKTFLFGNCGVIVLLTCFKTTELSSLAYKQEIDVALGYL